ncbi:MAG: type I secretion system permease/ATPase, partial [Hyphomicrobiaceae bacterium]
LPLRGEKLTIDLFPRAADRVGLKTRLVKRPIAKVPDLVAPFVVFFESGDTAVVTRMRKRLRRATVVFPSMPGRKTQSLPIRKLEAATTGYLFYVTAKDPVRDDPAPVTHHPQTRTGHWLLSAVWRFWPSWIQIALAALAINLLGLALPLFVMNVYDRVIPNLAIPTLQALAAGVVLALGFDFLLKQLRAQVLDGTGRRVDMKVASDLFAHALGLSMAGRPDASGSVANQIREFETVRDFFTSSSIIAVTDLLFIGVFVFVLWLIVGPLAYVPLAAVPIVLVATLLVQFPLGSAVRKAQETAGHRHALLVESLVGVETIKAIGGEPVMQRRWEEAVAGTARANSSTRFWSSLAINFSALVQQSVSVIIIVWGVFLVSDGLITVGGLIAANILSGRVLAPLGNIALTVARGQHALAALSGLNALMRLEPEEPATITHGQRATAGSVTFNNVAFAYPETKTNALHELSFHVEPGERIGIIGRIGSGKTTLGKLLAGLFDADSGSIQIDGVDIRHISKADLRADVGFISQDPMLFSGTLRDNLLMANRRASEAELDEAMRLAGVDTFVRSHPLGLNLPVGERGMRLSGGQRQAVGIARMLLRQPKIIFFDEPSSSMDVTSEAELIQRLSVGASWNPTIFVSTHRIQFLALTDRLLVLDNGRLVASGPKDEILKALARTSAQNPPASPSTNGDHA